MELHNYAEYQVGDDDGKGGRIALCPACGRPARVDRYTPIRGSHPAHYVHRVWLDDESPGQQFDRCRVDAAPRADGLSHETAAALTVWANDIRMLCLRLDAALGVGWFEAQPADHDARHYVEQRAAARAAAPWIAEVKRDVP
jgi:hypothetical protein